MKHRDAYLVEMGLGPLWKLRSPIASREPGGASEARAGAAVPCSTPDAEPVTAPSLDARRSAIAEMDWPELMASVAGCRACDLCKTRKQAVLGVGDVHADWLFVGEGPGAEEDACGEPFVGQAGKLLDAMLAAIDLKRGEDVYIANAVKCRPPDNRTPEPAETAACWPYLQRQIDLLKPKLIVALGRPAAQSLLNSEVKISASRGKLFEHRGIPVIVTYHPAYLLRTLQDKAKAWEDLVFARATMRKLKEY
jgi:uracil-DNA glycosylase